MFRNFATRIVNIRRSFSCGVRNFIREPSLPLRKCPKWVCAEDAVKIINSGINRVISIFDQIQSSAFKKTDSIPLLSI